MIKVAIIGVLGYAGEQLLKILIKHKETEIVYLGDKLDQQIKIRNIYDTKFDCVNTELDKDLGESNLKFADVVFLALPHGVSLEFVPKILNTGKRVIDLSADYRLKNTAIYEKWYKVKHKYPRLLKNAVYGLPELYREKIKTAELIANPGCYPTSIILGCIPLLKSNFVDLNSIITYSCSGISGAGRKFAQEYKSKNLQNTYPYQVGGLHRHIPEIEQELKLKISFTPYIIPQEQGMLSTICLKLTKNISYKKILSIYKNFYKSEPFVRILEDKLPETAKVVNTNFCDIAVVIDKRKKLLHIFSAIDNLIKGASGQAVQNMNIMFDIDEKCGLFDKTQNNVV
ncbi:MAG: N-acetyl-gamma-glutamyl-phosphate reductase [Elusimicrobiota bacterium]|nr:N-acetyl-gamma-glutamyl-phosphate reductase [Elusimicrobiota bacterium]